MIRISIEVQRITIFFYLNNCLKLVKKYEQKIIVKKNQLSKFFVTRFVVVVLTAQFVVIISATQFVVVVTTSVKQKRKRFKKIKWKKTFTNKNLSHKLLHKYNYYYVCN